MRACVCVLLLLLLLLLLLFYGESSSCGIVLGVCSGPKSSLLLFFICLFLLSCGCGIVGPTGVYLLDFFCSGIQFNLLLSPYPCFISLLYLDLYVLGDDALIS